MSRYYNFTIVKDWREDATIPQYSVRCVCDCGTLKVVTLSNLKLGKSRSCGCMRRQFDLTGERFGRWEVIREVASELTCEDRQWLCKCNCGNTLAVSQHSLRRGRSQSCGCLQKDVARENAKELFTVHGHTRHHLYSVWNGIMFRCYNSKSAYYKDYGGRGIVADASWCGINGFPQFLLDMENSYYVGGTIDRIDVNGNYTPSNCRWTDATQQVYNQRMRVTNTSGVTGVYLDKRNGKWLMEISAYGKKVRERFSTKEEAALRRAQLEIEIYGKRKGSP